MAGQQQTDPIVTWMVIFAMVFGALFGIWAINYKILGPLFVKIKMFELYPLTFISHDASAAYQRIDRYLAGVTRVMAMKQATNMDQSAMFGVVIWAGKQSGYFYHRFIGLVALVLMFYSSFAFPSNRFKNKFNMETFISMQAKVWPFITPFIKFNPSKGKGRAPGAKVPSELPLFSEALYPEEWMAYNRIRVVSGVPDRDQMRRALMLQLGERFESIEALPPHQYCLLAAFALKGGRKRDECDALLGEIAKCWSSEAGFVPTPAVKAEAAKIYANSKLAQPLLEILNGHAYVATAFIHALAWARLQGGVLAPAQFVWLRGEDRALWYPLNNLGRRAFHVEASGAMAHYMAEIEARRPLVVPRLDAAVVSITQYLSETRARIPELEGGGATPTHKPSVTDGRRPDVLRIGSAGHSQRK